MTRPFREMYERAEAERIFFNQLVGDGKMRKINLDKSSDCVKVIQKRS